jgi:hypothetical protein
MLRDLGGGGCIQSANMCWQIWEQQPQAFDVRFLVAAKCPQETKFYV